MKIFVGNLSRDVTDADLRQAFEAFGEVASAAVLKDKFSGESRGFGFVEMPAQTAAQAAIAGLNHKPLKGRTLNVNEARPRTDDRGGGGGGGGGGGRKPGGGGGGRPGGGRPGGGRRGAWWASCSRTRSGPHHSVLRARAARAESARVGMISSLVAIALALKEGRVTSRAYTADCLARCREREPRVQAWQSLDEGRALALAEECDRRRASGAELAALHGIPVGVKDIIDTADLPTEIGTPVFAGRRPDRDAAVVERLKRAGAFALGKTVTTEFAFMHPGKTRNPWHAEHTPGGSSSGSAAAVAAGLVPAAIGTQTNGSIIRPAAFCGVVGFKPTFGLIPTVGVSPFSETLDTIGTFAANVAGAARLAGPLADVESVPPDVSRLDRAPHLAALAQFPWNKLE